MPWSPRQSLQALGSTPEKGVQGMLRTSTLTEPVKLETYFKNGNVVPGGSSRARARHRACAQSRRPRVNGVPTLQNEDESLRPWQALNRRRVALSLLLSGPREPRRKKGGAVPVLTYLLAAWGPLGEP